MISNVYYQQQQQQQQHITIPKFQAINGFSCLSNIRIEYLPSKSEQTSECKNTIYGTKFKALAEKWLLNMTPVHRKKSEIEALEMG